jgi:hypothetical protein
VARRVGPRLGGCRIIAIHIKSLDHDEVVRELDTLAGAGLPLIHPEQGDRLTF